MILSVYTNKIGSCAVCTEYSVSVSLFENAHRIDTNFMLCLMIYVPRPFGLSHFTHTAAAAAAHTFNVSGSPLPCDAVPKRAHTCTACRASVLLCDFTKDTHIIAFNNKIIPISFSFFFIFYCSKWQTRTINIFSIEKIYASLKAT